jgi:TPR repeat protein
MSIHKFIVWLFVTMSKQLACLAVLMMLAASPVAAADFQKGVAAYERGDYATALKAWRPLAEQGHADAQYKLGGLYELGIGLPQDDASAARWYRAAAEKGNDRAQHKLGAKYERGRGVPQDYVLAHKWQNLAASQGHENAIRDRNIVATKMTPAQIAEAQKLAREWFERRNRK